MCTMICTTTKAVDVVDISVGVVDGAYVSTSGCIMEIMKIMDLRCLKF